MQRTSFRELIFMLIIFFFTLKPQQNAEIFINLLQITAPYNVCARKPRTVKNLNRKFFGRHKSLTFYKEMTNYNAVWHLIHSHRKTQATAHSSTHE